ncbi:hypothetical protein NW754_008219 [Fusarium falciforme]|uniref:Uncharacterized protein n=1 Tax=Fusarium falciforme TaxID=195108 RepID=A0A9W8UYC1_9HYPO|nr:hypothetical protein NW754_008219 [Fusarium falciforme]KAJ4182116.1 hypothetical protein NW755_010500 [Fusarium falciforme]KAJ4245669.1 hypothetical protein NW757_009932 [Fusarium falciforme]
MVPKPPRLFTRRSTPATRVFPNLRNIQPGLQPRRGGIPKNPNDAERRKTLRSMYQDMGVMVYSGISTEQVNRIGDVLNKATKPSFRLSIPPKEQDDAKFDKFTMYRLQTEEWHVDQVFKPKRGSITLEGLFDLALKAARQWAGHILEKAEGIESLKGSFGLTETEVKIAYDSTNRGGVILHTANGPRRLPVEAYVLAAGGNKFSLRVNLVSAGMRKSLGRVNINLVPYSKRDGHVDIPTWESTVKEIFELAPNDCGSDVVLLRETMDSFYNLEREVWDDIYLKEAEAKAKKEEEAESQTKKPEEIDAQPEQNSAEPSTKS